MPTIQDIFKAYPNLTNKQKGVLDYLRGHPDTITYITLKELSGAAGASEVSILRLCRTLGFDGFQSLKDQFRTELSQSMSRPAEERIRLDIPLMNLAGEKAAALKDILADEVSVMNDLLTGINGDMLFKCSSLMLKSSRILIFGHDGCKILGDFLSHRLNHLRLTASSLQMGNTDVVQLHLTKLRQGDFVVLFSYKDYYSRARTIARYATQRNIPVMLITDGPDSPAIPNSSYVFYCPSTMRASVNSFTAPASFINILTQCIAYLMGDEALADIAESMRRINRFIADDVDKEK